MIRNDKLSGVATCTYHGMIFLPPYIVERITLDRDIQDFLRDLGNLSFFEDPNTIQNFYNKYNVGIDIERLKGLNLYVLKSHFRRSCITDFFVLDSGLILDGGILRSILEIDFIKEANNLNVSDPRRYMNNTVNSSSLRLGEELLHRITMDNPLGPTKGFNRITDLIELREYRLANNYGYAEKLDMQYTRSDSILCIVVNPNDAKAILARDSGHSSALTQFILDDIDEFTGGTLVTHSSVFKSFIAPSGC